MLLFSVSCWILVIISFDFMYIAHWFDVRDACILFCA